MSVFIYLFIYLFLLQSLSHIMDASMEDLARCPGIGERKVILHTERHINFSFLFLSFSCIRNIVSKFLNLWCYQVKRLHDTFHEPFKRVVTIPPTVPETSTQNNSEPGSVNEDKEKEEKDIENESKRSKKEPDLTVKSALSAAFAKYADKVGRNNKKSQGEKRGETSSMEEKTEKENL